jgi:hypothetical protein
MDSCLRTGSSAGHRWRIRAAVYCQGWPEPSAGRSWPLRDLGSPTGRNRRSGHGRRPRGTGRSIARDPHEGLINVPSRGLSFYLALQPPIDLRTIGLSPTPDGRVIDRQTPLCHEFLEISQAQGKSAVPSDTGRDHDGLRLSLAKQRRPAGSHRATLPDSQTQHFLPNSPIQHFRPRNSQIRWSLWNYSRIC